MRQLKLNDVLWNICELVSLDITDIRAQTLGSFAVSFCLGILLRRYNYHTCYARTIGEFSYHKIQREKRAT
jgi:hypothetical protein